MYLYGNLQQPYQVTAVKEPDGTLTSYYYDSNGQLFACDYGSARYYVAGDQVGTPKVVTDTVGNVVKLLEYDSFGCLVGDSNPAFYLPVGFAGGLADPETGLVRFGMRDYDPVTGRWTARDPIFFDGGQHNLYAYCSSDPLNLIDPEGLSAWADCAAKCALDLLGIGLGVTGAGLVAAGQPTIDTRGKLDSGRSTAGTSRASVYLRQRFPKKINFWGIKRLWAPVSFRHVFSFAKTWGALAGRWVPVIGWALLAYDAYRFYDCMKDCLKEDC